MTCTIGLPLLGAHIPAPDAAPAGRSSSVGLGPFRSAPLLFALSPLLLLGPFRPADLRAQGRLEPSAAPMMYWSQLSRWVPDGGDSSISAVADTSLVLSWRTRATPGAIPDQANVYTGDFGGGWDVRLEHSPFGQVTGFTILADSNLSKVLSDSDFYRDEEFGTLIYEALAQRGSRTFRNGKWADTVTMRHETPALRSSILGSIYGGDTVTWRRIRSGTVTGEVSRGGRRWLVVEGVGHDSVVSARYIQSDFDRMREFRTSTGVLTEHYLVDPATGRIDSLRQHVEWRVNARYAETSGTPTLVQGRWTADRMANWGPDFRAQRDAANRFFWQHGRSAEADSTAFPEPIRHMVDASVRGDAIALDSLFSMRAAAAGMRQRWELEEALIAATRGGNLDRRFQQLARSYYRSGDEFLTRMIVSPYHEDAVVDSATALILADVFADVALERRNALDRQELFAHLFTLIGDSDSVTATAAPIMAAAAEQTTDPYARDLFYLAAYRGQPAMYGPLAAAKTDSVGGYGLIVRRYVAGDPGGLGLSWGWVERYADVFQFEPMPPLDGPWQPHEKRVTGFMSYWDVGRLKEWVAAHQPNAVEILLQRFASEPDPRGRLVWAQYLLQLGDTTAAGWVRKMEVEGDSIIRPKAAWVMRDFPIFADTLRTGPELDDLQWQLLGYAVGIWNLIDENGQPIKPFTVHDERPDLRLLSTANLTDRTRTDPRWYRYFQILTPDSLQARAEREGLVMAYYIGPVVKIGQRYEARVSLLPYMRPGGMCLCGGGTMLTLVRRDGKWVVTSSGSWVS